MPQGFLWRRLDVTDPAGWTVEPGTAVLSLLPLWLLPSLLPHLSRAGQIVALGSTSVLAKSGSADPVERDLARRLEAAEVGDRRVLRSRRHALDDPETDPDP